MLQLAENGSQPFVEHQIRPAVKRGRIPVDQHQAIPTVIMDESGGGIHRQACTRHDEQIGITDGSDAVFPEKTEMFEQFIPDAENIDVMIAEVQRALNDEYDNMAQNLSIAELKIAYKFVSGTDDGSVSGADC